MATSKREPALQPTGLAVESFLSDVASERRRADAHRICALMKEATGEDAAMWGGGIIGFGSYRYRYPSGREGEAPLAGFAPRKQHLVVYLVGGYEERYGTTLARLGPHKTGKGCLYLRTLDGVDMAALQELIDRTARVHRRVDVNRRT
jgi:hypothetical protein